MNHADQDPVGRAALVAALVNIAIRVLSGRVMILVMLTIDAAAFGYAMVTESWMRLAGAVILAAVAWATVHLKLPDKESDDGT